MSSYRQLTNHRLTVAVTDCFAAAAAAANNVICYMEEKNRTQAIIFLNNINKNKINTFCIDRKREAKREYR